MLADARLLVAGIVFLLTIRLGARVFYERVMYVLAKNQAKLLLKV